MKARMTWGLWLAVAMAGCGGDVKEEQTAAVDPNDPAAYSKWLTANGIEWAPGEPGETARGEARSDQSAFPICPRGEVRAAALGRYRVDTDADFPGGGTIEFRKGKDALWKSDAAFDPQHEATVVALPAAVTATLREGDTVWWGLYGAKKGRDAVTSFRIVNKPAFDKALARFEADKRVRAQPDVVRDRKSVV